MRDFGRCSSSKIADKCLKTCGKCEDVDCKDKSSSDYCKTMKDFGRCSSSKIVDKCAKTCEKCGKYCYKTYRSRRCKINMCQVTSKFNQSNYNY